MAKRKTKTQEAVEISTENLQAETPEISAKASSLTGGCYSGKVSISLRYGNKEIKHISVKNQGGRALFEFLAKCCAGQRSDCYPSQVVLLNSKSYKFPEEDKVHNDEDWPGWETAIDISRPVGFAKRPIPNAGTDDNGNSDSSYELTYSFLIPFTSLTYSTEATAKVTAILLVNNDFGEVAALRDPTTKKLLPAAEYCAFIALDDPIDLYELSSNIHKNFNIYLTWTLKFGNK